MDTDMTTEQTTSVLEQLEQQFVGEHGCYQCVEKAIWLRTWTCCGQQVRACGMHKYGVLEPEGSPIHPMTCKRETLLHVACGQVRPTALIWVEDTWAHL